uniref:Apolipoprotein A2 n=1 Tax=Pavo cristatus TaxID=9049 RepID=A0A8C9EGQ5_PAVCR
MGSCLWAAPITSALLLAVSPAELARSGFWEYLSQLTSDKDSLEQAQGSKLGREFTNLKESFQDGVSNVGNFLEKLAPLNRGIQPRLYHDSDSLRKLIRKELETAHPGSSWQAAGSVLKGGGELPQSCPVCAFIPHVLLLLKNKSSWAV